MTTPAEKAFGVNASGKLVLAFMAFGLVIIFASSFLYRLERPSLVMRQKTTPEAMEQAVNSPMREVLAMMQKLQENPDDPGLQLAMAERFAAMGAYDKAKTFLDKVLKTRPDDTEVQNTLGVVLYNLQDAAGAKDAFEKALSVDPNNYQARCNLGLLYKHALNAPDKAAEAFRAVLASPGADAQTRQVAQKELEGMTQP